MPLKAATTTLLAAVTTLRTSKDTDIADTDLQIITRGQL